MRWLRCATAALLLLSLTAVLAPNLGADEKKAEKGEHAGKNKAIVDSLATVINKGADIFNSGDYYGCYRLYEGALLGVKPLLEHKPALQKRIDDAFAEAERQSTVPDRAFALRRAIDDIRKDLKGGGGTSTGANTLWDRLGGEANVKKVVDDFVTLAAGDKKVNFFRSEEKKKEFLSRPENVTHLKEGLVDFVSSATGGPRKYTGPSMKEVHKGMKITDAEFDALAADLKKALEKNGAKPDDVKAVLDAVNGTRKDIVEKEEAVAPPKKLWDRLGGEANVKRVVDDFVKMAGDDPKVNFFRTEEMKTEFLKKPENMAHLKKELVDFISSKTGGPYDYTGKSMKDVHKGMKITDEEFDAAAEDLKKALEKNGAKPDDVKAVLEAVGKTRGDIVEARETKEEKLWDRLGGEANVKKVVDDFVDLAGKDKKVNFFRSEEAAKKVTPEDVDHLKKQLIDFISAATGGPHKYNGKAMKEAHKGMKITDAEFDALAADLKKALEKNGAKPDDVKAVLDAVNGTRKDIVEKD